MSWRAALAEGLIALLFYPSVRMNRLALSDAISPAGDSASS
jgi:hypothetical protein